MAKRDKMNKMSQPKKTRPGVIDISKGGLYIIHVGIHSIFLLIIDDDEEGVLDNLLQCLQTGSVFKQ